MTPEKDRIFKEIFIENSGRLYQYIYRQVGDRSNTEDILQEVFIALLFHLWEFTPEYPDNAKRVKAWLFGAADKKLLHFWREKQKILDMEISAELLPDLADRKDDLGESEFSLPDCLSPEDKRLLFLKSSGYSLHEIAVFMGLTYGACRMRSSRLKRELEKFFQK